MTDHSHARLRQLFDIAFDLPAAARSAFLREQCRDDKALLQRVQAMVAAAEGGQFLGSPTGEVPAGPPRPGNGGEAQSEGPGTWIGPYKLLQQLGEGGFGVVFLAEQKEPVSRRVALKIIKLGMDTKQVVARARGRREGRGRGAMWQLR